MKKLIVILLALEISSCATPPLKPADVQSKVALGMSVADVMATMGVPEEKKPLDNGQFKLGYNGYLLSFADGKLTEAQISTDAALSALALKPIEEQIPGYKPNSLVLNKEFKPVASPYQIAAVLQNETLFEKAVEAGVNRNGFTLKTNALCVALVEGYLNGTAAVLKAGFNRNIRLRTDKGIYILAKDCVSLQKDPVVAEELKKLLNSEAQTKAASVATQLKSSDSKNTDTPSVEVKANDEKAPTEKKNEDSDGLLNWEAIKEFLKPVGPLPDGKHPQKN